MEVNRTKTSILDSFCYFALLLQYTAAAIKFSVPDHLKYIISRFKVCYVATHFSFLKSCTKILLPFYLDNTFGIFSVHFLNTFTALFAEILLGKYFANPAADSWLQYDTFLFVIIPHYLLAGFYSSEFVICHCSPFLLAFVFFS